MLIRKPVVSGQFYQDNADRLNKQITECFELKFGPGDLPVSRSSKKITHGVISPHAGYQFSGPAAAWVYKEVAESRFPSRFIIIGPDHKGLGASRVSATLANWETPLGRIEVDRDFARDLMEKCSFVKEGNDAHANEHSIEVQLPFLQFVSQDRRDLRIVPLIVSDYDLDLCRELADAIVDVSEDFCVIASSDFTHYGPNYGYVPFAGEKKKNMYKLDSGAIEFIKKMDTKGFLKYVDENKATICGAGAIAVCLEIMKSLGVKKGELLSYYTSGDVINDYDNAVGYAAIKF